LAEEVLLSKTFPFDPYERYGGVGAKPDLADGYLVVITSVTTEYQDSRKHVEATLEAIHKLNKPTLWFGPTGRWSGPSTGIVLLETAPVAQRSFFFKNMEGKDFLQLLQTVIV
jgi:hypothetical protein